MSNEFGDVRAQIREQIEKLNTWVLIQDVETISGETLRQADVLPDLRNCLSSDESLNGTIAELKSMLEIANQEGGIPASELRQKLSNLQEKFEMAEAGPEGAAAAPEAASSAAEDPALVADFVIEAREHLSAVEGQLLTLENDPTNFECLNAIFRSFHSIKGLAAFLEFPRIQHFAHEVETLLDMARNKAVVIDATGIDLILACTDFLNRCIAAVESRTLAQVPRREDELIPRLQGFRNTSAPSGEEPKGEAEPARPGSSIAPEVMAALEAEGMIPLTPQEAQEPGSAAKPPQGVKQSAAAEKPSGEAGAASSPNSVTAAERYSVRVDTSKLDYLMDMVGELVITESLIKTELHAEYNLSNNLNRNMAQLARLTGDVQRATLTMRMVPIGQLFRRLARIVRDLARKFSKQVELRMEGEETELDKTIAEELADPLMHMVRNSLDHGVEDGAARLAAGKSPTSVLTLRAYHEAGQVVIEVEDDGRGINREKVRQKAIEQGLEVSETMSDSEILGLIFQPGFSTAEKVTDISGRGVGMDVVRRQVDKLRGKVDVESATGKGTKFVIKLPLTRAIIEGLIVSVGKLRCIVPLSTVKEVLRPKKEALSSVLGKQEMVMVHDRLLPIVRLHSRFSVVPKQENPDEAVLIVCEGSGRMFCLMIDSLDGKQEVVIKNLGPALKKTADVQGGAILGDGRVGLILDVAAIGGAIVNG